MTGGVDLLGEGPLALSARRRCRPAGPVSGHPPPRGSGAARLSVDVTGTRCPIAGPGTLELEGAGLRVRGFPHGVGGLKGTVRFTETAAELDGVTGPSPEGRLTIEGEAAYAGAGWPPTTSGPPGRACRFAIPRACAACSTPSFGCSATRIGSGSPGRSTSGRRCTARRYDVASELLSMGRSLAPATPASLEEGAQLDLAIRAPGTLRIDNNLASLTARADLALQGTTQAPVVTGPGGDRGRTGLLPGPDLRDPPWQPRLRQPAPARPARSTSRRRPRSAPTG